ncbi:MAG TPA: GGDEF domain-containing protein [Motiliproteus sp.]
MNTPTDTPHGMVSTLLRRLLGDFQLQDILRATHHSADFDETRAAYLRVRLRFMLLFFILAVPAWLPIDYFTLEPSNFNSIAIARLCLTFTLLVLLLLCRRKANPKQVTALLCATMLASTLFYLVAMATLHTGVTEEPLAGYSAMPMMMIALTGLFPVTLLLGTALIVAILVCYLALQAWLGTLLTSETLNTLWVLGLIAGVTLWIQCGQLLMLLKLYRESTRDALTGLINRRVLMKQLQAQMMLAENSRIPFSVMMCDLDRFKRINDTHGHLVGDEILKLAATLLQQKMRREDIVARFGGEEFMILIPSLNTQQALPLAEAVRAAFEDAAYHTDAGVSVPVTTSIGLTDYLPGEAVEVLLERADTLLYRAKQQGRNQVITCQEPLQNACA